jgi:hypothetical protein
VKSRIIQINFGDNSVNNSSLSILLLVVIAFDKCAAKDNSLIPFSSILEYVLYKNKEEINTTKANILLSYVFVLLSILEVPSLSKNTIFAFPFNEFFGVPHNHIPFVQLCKVDATSNHHCFPIKSNNKFIK